jgi:hypothetical protein
VHGIFLGNEKGRADNSFKYQNIQILDNKIASGHVLGLVVEHANNVTIRGNDVRIHPDLPKKAINTPVIDVTPDSTNVVITGNIAHRLPDQNGVGWVISGNQLVSSAGSVSVVSDTSGGASGGGSTVDGGTDFRFSGIESRGDIDRVSGFDFADGDRIILKEYAAGTLKGYGGGNPLAVNSAGTYAVLDSMRDIAELASASAAVTAKASGDALILSIVQSGVRHEIHLADLADDFLGL